MKNVARTLRSEGAKTASEQTFGQDFSEEKKKVNRMKKTGNKRRNFQKRTTKSQL